MQPPHALPPRLFCGGIRGLLKQTHPVLAPYGILYKAG